MVDAAGAKVQSMSWSESAIAICPVRAGSMEIHRNLIAMEHLRKILLLVVCAMVPLSGVRLHAQAPATDQPWLMKVRSLMPLLGHRNWILVVDSAYPLQTSPGVETIETGGDQIQVLKEVLGEIDQSIHVRPNVFMDAELPFVPEREAKGANRYREEVRSVLGNRPVTSLPHEEILRRVGETGRSFHILVLKTNQTVPYTSVFLQLNCKYWSDSAEEALRAAMKKKSAP